MDSDANPAGNIQGKERHPRDGETAHEIRLSGDITPSVCLSALSEVRAALSLGMRVHIDTQAVRDLEAAAPLLSLLHHLDAGLTFGPDTPDLRACVTRFAPRPAVTPDSLRYLIAETFEAPEGTASKPDHKRTAPMTSTPAPVKVLVVDDSPLMRRALSDMLCADPEIDVVGTAPDAIVAQSKILSMEPDVITLDIAMPRMDGLSFLRQLMKNRPMPVVMVSSYTREGAELTLEALELGAFDFITKPVNDSELGLGPYAADLITKVKLAARAPVRPSLPGRRPGRTIGLPAGAAPGEKLVLIGASTGGVEALREVLSALPTDGPPVLVVQHMPARFTESFADRLNQVCAMYVSEARDGERILPGHVYVAKGDRHLEVTRDGAHLVCRLSDDEPSGGHRPSVDHLFWSAAEAIGPDAVGVLLTGMGSDGAAGLASLRETGAWTIAQDEASCVIYGMPRAAVERRAACEIVHLTRMPVAILDACRRVRTGRPGTVRRAV